MTPEAKRALLHALQDRGEVVAMTGDGVNDTLALKDADLGIAMGAGTPAAKSVSDIVLLDNRFATLPSVVAEGRRVIANIERVARLFLTKTVWAAVLAVLTGRAAHPVPAASAPPHRRRCADDRHPRVRAVVPAQPRPGPARVHPARAAILDPCRPDQRPGDDVGLRARQRDVRPVRRARPERGDAHAGRPRAVGAVRARPPARPIRGALIVVLVVMAIGAFTIPFVADFFLLEIPPADYADVDRGHVTAACALIHVALRIVEETDLRPFRRSPTDFTGEA